jgi:hypothetical protein
MESKMAEYIAVGVFVYSFVFYRLAYYFANSQKDFMSGHSVSTFVDRGIKPSLGEYIGALLWGPQLVLCWPIIVLYYFMKLFLIKSSGKS